LMEGVNYEDNDLNGYGFISGPTGSY